MTGYEPKRVTLMSHLLHTMMIIATYALFITIENGLGFNWINYCPREFFVTNFRTMIPGGHKHQFIPSSTS
jgi:hypothetical protein